MGPTPVDERADHHLFRTKLLPLINQRHQLVRLSQLRKLTHQVDR